MDKESLVAEITGALRAHDKARLSILRQVKNEVDIKEKTSGEAASPQDVVGALKKVLKQTRETLDGSIKAGTNAERTGLLQNQVDILQGYLPRQLEGPKLEAVIDRVLADNGFAEKRDMGRAIGLVVIETGGNVDKAEVARMVGAKLA